MGLSRISWVESKTKSGHWFVVVLPTVVFCCIAWKVGAVCTYSLGSAIVVVVVSMCLVDAHLLVDCWVGSPCSIFLESQVEGMMARPSLAIKQLPEPAGTCIASLAYALSRFCRLAMKP